MLRHSEIPEPGDYCTKLIGLQPVIMTRDEDGQVHLLMNRCAHRGNTVCEHSRGNAHVFRCAYHGWTYNNAGELLGIPFGSGYDRTFIKDEHGLREVPRIAIYRGFVFGSLSPSGISLNEHLGNARPVMDRFIDLAPDGEIAVRGGLMRREYGRSHGVGLVDALIAASGEKAGATVVTLNAKHFPMVKNVVVPYRKGHAA